MAQLSTADQQKMQTRGLWVKEKCDRSGCGLAISWVTWVGRSGKHYCSRPCREMEEPSTMSRSEMREFRKQKGGERAVKDATSTARTPTKELVVAVLGLLRKERKGGWKLGTVIEILAPTIPDLDSESRVKRAVRRCIRKGKVVKTDDGHLRLAFKKKQKSLSGSPGRKD